MPTPTPESHPPVEIAGGAGPYEAAAIAAVIAQTLAEAAAAGAQRPRPPRPTAWVRSYQGFHADDPLPVILPDPRGSRAGY
jgi:hypothetical protein